MLTTENMMLLSLVLMRMSGCIFLNPILGRRNIPSIVKAGMAVIFTLLVYSAASAEGFQGVLPIEYGVLLLKEFAVGCILGFIISLFLYVIIFGGEIIDLQLGISMSKIYDAQSNASISISGTFYNIAFMLIFFASDAHLNLIHILLDAGKIVPYGEIVIEQNMMASMISLFCQCSIMAVKFSFPIFAAEFLAEVGVGILMKTIPQINVFVINVQSKVFIGLLLLFILLVPMTDFLEEMIVMMFDTMSDFLSMM